MIPKVGNAYFSTTTYRTNPHYFFANIYTKWLNIPNFRSTILIPWLICQLCQTVPAGRIVEFFDGDVGLWRIVAAEEAKGECERAAEEEPWALELGLS